MIVCPPHIPKSRIDMAVSRIRSMRGVNADLRCGFPDDLGCETQLYLGSALFRVFPRERLHVIGQCCGVNVPDAMFFAMLVSIAEHARPRWMKPAIVNDAALILQGLPVEPLPQERAARRYFSQESGKAPLDMMTGARAGR